MSHKTPLRAFLEQFDDDAFCQIIEDYDSLEDTGVTGDTLLRRVAERFHLEHLGDSYMAPILLMDQVVKEVYRSFAYRYVSLLD